MAVTYFFNQRFKFFFPTPKSLRNITVLNVELLNGVRPIRHGMVEILLNWLRVLLGRVDWFRREITLYAVHGTEHHRHISVLHLLETFHLTDVFGFLGVCVTASFNS